MEFIITSKEKEKKMGKNSVSPLQKCYLKKGPIQKFVPIQLKRRRMQKRTHQPSFIICILRTTCSVADNQQSGWWIQQL